MVMSSRMGIFVIRFKVCHVRLDDMTPGIGQRVAGLFPRHNLVVAQRGVNEGRNAVTFRYRAVEIENKL